LIRCNSLIRFVGCFREVYWQFWLLDIADQWLIVFVPRRRSFDMLQCTSTVLNFCCYTTQTAVACWELLWYHRTFIVINIIVIICINSVVRSYFLCFGRRQAAKNIMYWFLALCSYKRQTLPFFAKLLYTSVNSACWLDLSCLCLVCTTWFACIVILFQYDVTARDNVQDCC